MAFPSAGLSLAGARRLAGITDQISPSNIFKFQWYQPDGATVLNSTGFLVPLSGSITHANDIKYLKDSRGNTVCQLATDERLTIQVVATPNGAPGASSLTEALQSASFPAPNGWVTISHAPVIAIGTFLADDQSKLDAFNSSGWIYNGDGSLEMASDNEWGMRFTLTRFAFLPKTAAVII
jgi:hypothetical protein